MRSPEQIDNPFRHGRWHGGSYEPMIEYGTQEQVNREVDIDIDYFAGGDSPFEQLGQAGAAGLFDAVAPGLRELGIRGGMPENFGHDAHQRAGPGRFGKVPKEFDNLRAGVSRIPLTGKFSAEFADSFQAKRFLTGPVLVNCGFTHTGRFGNGIHAETVDAASADQL
jgi:hypothetical protein